MMSRRTSRRRRAPVSSKGWCFSCSVGRLSNAGLWIRGRSTDAFWPISCNRIVRSLVGVNVVMSLVLEASVHHEDTTSRGHPVPVLTGRAIQPGRHRRSVKVVVMDRTRAGRLIQRPHGQAGSRARRPAASAVCAAGMSLLLLLAAVFGIVPVATAQAAPDLAVPPSASCAALARLEPTATNGNVWGHTILPGHGAPGGWFGVDVCDNGVNASAPGGANVSCDQIPAKGERAGCAPGHATSDGYGLTFQCVELIIRFSAWAFGDSVGGWGRSGSGNAPDLWLPENHPTDFIMYPNGSDHAPVPGDILVWGNLNAQGQPWPSGADGEHGGHIAVVAAVHDGMVITAEQNVKWDAEDHPSDTLALTKAGSHWILSGSTQHETRLPTYRWLRTMGTSRATYGWLHSTKNHGRFPSPSASSHSTRPTTPAKPATPTQTSGGLPSLAAAVVVTKDGSLADLVWSQSSPFTSGNTSTAPHAELRSLGAPPGVRLVPGQTPATVQLTDGSRYCYAVGSDGHLYVARTAPGLLGVWWTDLGMPGSVELAASPSASAYAGGVAVAAIGADGNLWWRTGPVAAPGGWELIGHPDASQLAGGFAVAGAPGNGSPLLLALGVDGRLYERIWQPAILNSDGSVQAPASWSQWITVHSQPDGVQLAGKLLIVPESVKPTAWAGSWPDTPLDVLMADSTGKVWWLRSTAFAAGWVLNTVPVAVPVSTLIAGVVVPGQTVAAELDFYAMTARAPYEARLAIPAHPHDLVPAPTWLQLASVPAGMTSGVAGAAVALGPGESNLLIPEAASALAGGATDATSMLVSADSALLTTSGDPRNAWVALGTVATAPAFADPLDAATVNTQWLTVGDGSAVTESASGLRMVPGAGGSAALLQGTFAGDVSVAVRVALPARSASDTSAGLILYLDGGDWLALTTNVAQRVSLCVWARSKAVPCTGRTAALPASARAIWLQVTRHATTFTASYSADGQTWIAVGQWTAGMASDRASASAATATATTTPGTPAPTATPTSPAGTGSTSAASSGAAPLGFTEWGLFISVNGGATSLPLFTDFTIGAVSTGA